MCLVFFDVQTAGCGKPVLLVHGFGASCGHYRKTIPFLAQNGYKVGRQLSNSRSQQSVCALHWTDTQQLLLWRKAGVYRLLQKELGWMRGAPTCVNACRAAS